MNAFQQVVSTMTAPGLVIIIALVIIAAGFKQGWIGQFILALNSLNTPWVAIIVVVLGMLYNLKCKAYGLPSDSANQVIGGGLGLLTGQALKNGAKDPLAPPPQVQTTTHVEQTTTESNTPPPTDHP